MSTNLLQKHNEDTLINMCEKDFDGLQYMTCHNLNVEMMIGLAKFYFDKTAQPVPVPNLKFFSD